MFIRSLFFILALPACQGEVSMNQTMEMETNKNSNMEYATFGGGCYWCLETLFQQLKGVVSVESGFSGGHVKNPSYKEVCTGKTGHAEVIHIKFNPSEISFGELLGVFFATHDPTTLNRQGGDIGTQYRSVVFYHNEEQRNITKDIISRLSAEGEYDGAIVTEITAFEAFYKAEDYHQDYYNNNMEQPYCEAVIRPKVEKFRKQFAGRLK
jgi:peptide-methionine (S)-S-oxide reductase